jgi:hypothetical protein
VITYVFEKTVTSGWMPRTSYSDNPTGVERKMAGLVEQDFGQVGEGPTGLLFVYFAGGKVLGNDAHNMPEVIEYDVKYIRPEIVRK